MYKEELAKNPNTPVEILKELSKDSDYWVRGGVSKNPNTPVEVLVELSKDKDEDIRRSVAENPNTPVETLIELSKDESLFVRCGVARNPNTSSETLEKSCEVDMKCTNGIRDDVEEYTYIKQDSHVDTSDLSSEELYTLLHDDVPDLKDELVSLLREGGTLELKINKILDNDYQVTYRFPGLITDRSIQSYIENMIKNNKDSYDDSVVNFVISQFKKEVINNFFDTLSKEFEELTDACRYSQLTSDTFTTFVKSLQSNRDK